MRVEDESVLEIGGRRGDLTEGGQRHSTVVEGERVLRVERHGAAQLVHGALILLLVEQYFADLGGNSGVIRSLLAGAEGKAGRVRICKYFATKDLLCRAT